MSEDTDKLEKTERIEVSDSPKPPRQPQRRNLPYRQPPQQPNPLPPWWSVLLTLLLACMGVASIAVLVILLGNQNMADSSPRLEITRVTENLNTNNIAQLVTPTIPPEFNNQIMPTADLVMSGPTLPPPPITPTPEAIELNKIVAVIDVGEQQLNVRDQPGVLGTTIVFRAPEQEQFLIVDGPTQADGLTWWFIQDPNNPSRAGWAASNYLLPIPQESQ